MAFSLFCFTNSYAQFKIYKISKGTKTELANGGLLEIEVDVDWKPMDKFLLEIDVKKFREKFKYDVISLKWGGDGGSIDAYLSHEFDSELSKKKYANVNKFNVYLFKTANISEEVGNFFLSNKQIANWQINYTGYKLSFGANYITGVENYYDENSKSIKVRNVYSKLENLFALDLKFVNSASTQAAAIEKKYKETFDNDFSKVQKYYIEYGASCAKNLRNVNSNIPIISIVVFIQKYKQIPLAIEEITKYHFELLKAEKDKAKALEMYDNWINKKGRDIYCIEEYKSNKDKLKKLEKDLKSATSVEQKIDLIKAALG